MGTYLSPGFDGQFYRQARTPLLPENNTLQHAYRALTHDQVKVVHSTGKSSHRIFKLRTPQPDSLFDVPPHLDNSANREFVVQLFAPPGNQPARRLVIMYNGLDETPHFVKDDDGLYGLYSRLGTYLAERGVAALLIPTPYHLNRAMTFASKEALDAYRGVLDAKQKDFIDWTIPSNALVRSPLNMYRNHYQGFRETLAVCCALLPQRTKHVTNAPSGVISPKVIEQISPLLDLSRLSISLLGYSIGGLRAITEFILDRQQCERPGQLPLFSSCVTIASGGSLAEITGPQWIHDNAWQQMIHEIGVEPDLGSLSEVYRKSGLLDDHATMHAHLLRDVCVGKALSLRRLERMDSDVSRRLFFVLGGQDPIVGRHALDRFTLLPGLNIFQVAGMGHDFRFGAWRRWEEPLFNVITHFINTVGSETSVLARSLAVLSAALQDVVPRDANLDDDTMFHESQLRLKQRAESPTFVQDVFQGAFQQRALANISAQDLAAFGKYAIDELHKRAQQGDCNRKVYQTIRTQLLLGWHISHDLHQVALFDSIIREPANAGKRLGDLLVELKIVHPAVRTRALQAHSAAMEHARAELYRTCIEWINHK